MHKIIAARAVYQLELSPDRKDLLEIDQLYSIIELFVELSFSQSMHFQAQFIEINLLYLFILLEVLLVLHGLLGIYFKLNLDILALVLSNGIHVDVFRCIAHLIHKHDLLVALVSKLRALISGRIGVVRREHIV